MLTAGDRLGDYEILQHVTSGGMAALYLGRRTGARGFEKLVAIKVVHERLTEEEDIQRMFVDEAILSSHLAHPNIVHVEEFGESGKHLYLVMEYVDGCSLTDLLKHLQKHGRMLSVPHAVRVAIEVAAGLHAAHESLDHAGRPLHVVHRDVSPGNVLLSKAGHIKMIDFGIATSAAQVNESIEGNFKGKFRYMSPEQASGAPVDRRTDIYSLGLLLWELLTGRPALRSASNLGILELARNPDLEPPSAYRSSGVSRDLDAALLWALAVNADDRPGTAQDFRRALMDACPEALRVEPEVLGELIRTVPAPRRRTQSQAPSVNELIFRSTSTLPPNLSASATPGPSTAPPSTAPPPTAGPSNTAIGAGEPNLSSAPSSPAPLPNLASDASAPAPRSRRSTGPGVRSISSVPMSDGRKSVVDMMLDQLPDFSATTDEDRTVVDPGMLEQALFEDETFADPAFEEKVAHALRQADAGATTPPRPFAMTGSVAGSGTGDAELPDAASPASQVPVSVRPLGVIEPVAPQRAGERSAKKNTGFFPRRGSSMKRYVVFAILLGVVGIVASALALLVSRTL